MTTLQQRLEWASQAGGCGELAKQAIFEAESRHLPPYCAEVWERIAVGRARSAWRYAKSAVSGILFPDEQEFESRVSLSSKRATFPTLAHCDRCGNVLSPDRTSTGLCACCAFWTEFGLYQGPIAGPRA